MEGGLRRVEFENDWLRALVALLVALMLVLVTQDPERARIIAEVLRVFMGLK